MPASAPVPGSSSTASPADSSAVNPYQMGSLRRLNAAPKLGPIGQAARTILLKPTQSNSSGTAGGSTVSAGTEYAKKLLDQSNSGDPTGKGKDKTAGNGGPHAAGIHGLSGEELRSIIEAEKGIRGAGERRKYLKDVYAQLSGQLPASRELAQQLTSWKNDPGFNQLFGYKVTNEGGQGCKLFFL